MQWMTLLTPTMIVTYTYLGDLGVFTAANAQPNVPPTLSKPNVIVFLWDDLGWGCLNQNNPELRNMVPGITPNPENYIYTPNIDRIMVQGMRFTHAYVASPLCSPSRFAFMTGQRTDQTTFRANGVTGQALNMTNKMTIAKLFKMHGYTTIKFGKHSMGRPKDLGSPANFGYEQFLGYGTDVEAHFVYPNYLWRVNGTQVLFKNNRAASIKKCGQANHPCTYSSDLFLQEFTTFINSQNASSKPFYAELALIQPHVGAFTTKPSKQYCLIPDYGQYTSRISWSPNRRGFAAMVSYIDTVTAKVFDLVEQANLSNNTLIIFTSDNGAEYDPNSKPNKGLQPLFFQANGGLRLRKRFTLEGGVRVPFFAVWLGVIAPNIKSSVPIALYDLLKTFEHLMSLYQPAGRLNDQTLISTIDSPVSILPVLLSKDGKNNGMQRENLAVEYCPGNVEKNCKYGFYGIYDNALMKLVYDVTAYDVVGFGTNSHKSLQLYNLTADPMEAKNLIKDPNYAGIVAELQNRRKVSRLPLRPL